MTAATPQDLVEHALKTSTSDECVVIVHDSTSANLRWANNTLTTNGVMHAHLGHRRLVPRRREGTAAGVGHPQRVLDRPGELDRRGRPTPPRRAGTPAEDAAELVPRALRRRLVRAAGETSIEVFSDFAPALGEAFGRAEAENRVLYGFVDHDVTTTYLGLHHRLAAAARAAHRALRLHREADRPVQQRLGRRCHPRLHRRRRARDGRRSSPGGSAGRERRVELPAGRYDTILPPAAVADLMIYAYWTASARDAHDGQTVFSKRGGGTRIGERLSDKPLQLFSDPAYAGLEAAPFVTASSSDEIESVFDNGLPLSRTDWISDGTLTALLQTRYSAALTGQPVTPSSTTSSLSVDGATGCTEDLVAGVERGLLVTCLWYIREVDPQTPAADRADPRRGLPRRERRGDRRGEQLPVQREPGRPARRFSPRPGRCRASRVSGATTSRAPRRRRSGSPTSTCPPSPRPTDRRPVTYLAVSPACRTPGDGSIRRESPPRQLNSCSRCSSTGR